MTPVEIGIQSVPTVRQEIPVLAAAMAQPTAITMRVNTKYIPRVTVPLVPLVDFFMSTTLIRAP